MKKNISLNPFGRIDFFPEKTIDATIVVAGDYYIREPESGNLDFGGADASIVAPIKPWISDSDYAVVNLESPLSVGGAPIPKCGPNLRMPPERVDFIHAAGFNVASLANNHMGDFGPEAALDTLNVLDKAGIPYVGAGKDLTDARKPLFLEANGKKIAILNYAENEFGGATENQAGASTLDLPDNIRQVRQVSRRVDITLVIIHGGTELYPFPAPDRAKSYRILAESGATAIISHHPHTPQGIEFHEGVPIVYSTGNFFFPPLNKNNKQDDFWSIGYAVKLLFAEGEVAALEILPYQYGDLGPFEILEDEKKKEFVDYINRLSEPLKETRELEDFFAAYVYKRREGLVACHGMNISSEYKGELFQNTLIRRNFFTCEAHAEVSRTFLRLVETNQLGVKGKDKGDILSDLTDASKQLPSLTR